MKTVVRYGILFVAVVLFSYSITLSTKAGVVDEGQWNITLGGNDLDMAHSVVEVEDGYIVAGQTYSYGNINGFSDIWIVKINDDLDIAWQQTYGGTGNDAAYMIRKAGNDFIIVG